MTVDRINDYPTVVSDISSLVEHDQDRARVRIVFEKNVPTVNDDAIVTAALASHLVVLARSSTAKRCPSTTSYWQMGTADLDDAVGVASRRALVCTALTPVLVDVIAPVELLSLSSTMSQAGMLIAMPPALFWSRY